MACIEFGVRDTLDHGFICTRGRRKKSDRCEVCRQRPATLLCDGPGSRPGKTCDAKLCKRCAKPGARQLDLFVRTPRDDDDSIDYCPRHAAGL